MSKKQNYHYLKYYWLEKYLETEVFGDFHTKHHLTPEQFFSIIIWKRNASKTSIKRKLLDGKPITTLSKTIEEITHSIYKAPSKEEKLRCLLKVGGIDLAIASAVLTILYPTEFSVYDFRVREEIHGYKDITPLPIEAKIKKYLDEYIPSVRKSAHLSLRDCDRALWGKSWHEDLQKFVKSVDKPGRKNLEKYL